MEISEVFEFLIFPHTQKWKLENLGKLSLFSIFDSSLTLYPKTTKNELRRNLKDYKMVYSICNVSFKSDKKWTKTKN